MKKSESIAELSKALVLAQKAMKPALKEATNPFFKSKYADLQSIWESIREPFTENGLSVVQTSSYENGTLVLETMLLHTSGEWISGEFPVIPQKSDPQSLGSCVSYIRRYSLAAMCGVVTSDDDAEAAMDRSETKRDDFSPVPKTQNYIITEPQAKRLFAIAKSKNWTNEGVKELLEKYGYTSTSQIKFSDYEKIIADIEGQS